MIDIYAHEVWIQFLINLSRYIDSRVSNSGRHSAQVAHFVRATARKLRLEEGQVQAIFWAAMLHDIGKVGVPEQVLSKAGPLDDREWSMIKLHPTVGANIVRTQKAIAHIAPFIASHQEKFDGSGYPDGLAGEQIPEGARIVAVADAYEAMTSDRFYRRALTHPEASCELRRMCGSQFDPAMVDAFLEVVDEDRQD